MWHHPRPPSPSPFYFFGARDANPTLPEPYCGILPPATPSKCCLCPPGGVAGGERCPHLGKTPQEAVGDGDVDVEVEGAEDALLHGNQLLPLVGIVADVEEVVHARRALLLERGEPLSALTLTPQGSPQGFQALFLLGPPQRPPGLNPGVPVASAQWGKKSRSAAPGIGRRSTRMDMPPSISSSGSQNSPKPPPPPQHRTQPRESPRIWRR